MIRLAAPLFGALFFGCGGGPTAPSGDGGTPELGEVAPPPPEVVSATTDGIVSRKSPVRVRFVSEVGPEGGGPASPSPIQLVPRVAGSAEWVSRRELVFTPAADLTPGQAYQATVDLPAILGGDGHPAFAFTFQVVPQSWWAEQAGLEAAGPGKQRFKGVLHTADDVGPEVERVLAATQEGRTLPVRWVHEDGRRHAFVVEDIARAEGSTELQLAFDGAPIGVASGRTEKVRVHGLADFDLSSANALSGGDRAIELRFTDPVDPAQDLGGLIRADGHPELRFTRDGSVVRVYSSQAWEGEVTVHLSPVLRSDQGYALAGSGAERITTVSFEARKPSVSFVGQGVIVPSSEGLTVPVEVVNVAAIEVEATRVYESNLPQFLQVNRLDGDQELHRVGRVVYRERIPVPGAADRRDQTIRVGLELGALVADDPHGLYRLAVRFDRADIVYDCPGPAPDPRPTSGELPFARELPVWDWERGVESSFWDSWSSEETEDAWERREDPCHPGYYQEYWDHDITASRNVLVSDVGLIAKMGADDEVVAVVTDIPSARATSGASVEVLDYQLQPLARGTTGPTGVVRLGPLTAKPLAVIAHHDEQAAMVRLDRGSSLALGHFDVSGVSVATGLKGFLYGERGVWRPGDAIHLTFVLHDETGKLPADHPLQFEVRDPRGQVAERRVVRASEGVGGFYPLGFATAPDAPTGDYVATVRVGGASFVEVLRVDTVMPNRLAIDLPVPAVILGPEARLVGTLSSRWLHGALARHLDAKIEVDLSARPTTFPGYEGFVFDDPTAQLQAEGEEIFAGTLDATGAVAVDVPITIPEGAPGMLTATLTTRVFEPGGAFSIDRTSVPLSPHARYVGLRTPKGDVARGMLLTDQQHPIEIAVVDASGRPAGDGQVRLELYKVAWRWWWEKGEESFVDYAGTSSHEALSSGVVDVRNGKASWPFEIKYPDWGRYLIVATDLSGTHRAGRLVYVDWPGWAGRAQGDNPGGAGVLTLTADRSEVQVGEQVKVTFPTAAGSRALVSLETGSEVLETTWLEPQGDTTTWSFTATPAMAPSVYASVTLLQPLAGGRNDLPIRLFGVAPVRVTDPDTRLQPVISAPAELQPERVHEVVVAEATGRPMTYTLAVVDQGLLGLTRFRTPDPWEHFFQREALGVRTWDVFDLVAGAFGGAFDALLAIGGDGQGEGADQSDANRFEPVVRFFGPYHLARGESRKHQVDVGQYIGEVRMMVVAGEGGAFGSAEKAVPVRTPLMVLATLPRVLGPQERLALPVSVFALDESIDSVDVSVATEGPVAVDGERARTVKFSGPGDRLVNFDLAVADQLGVGRVTVTATGGGEKATQTIEIGVRHPGVRATDVIAGTVKAGARWEQAMTLAGLPGTRSAILEVSRVPPLDLARRLDALVHYPHGCVEQTTSAVFPQIHLADLVELKPEREHEVTRNVEAGIQRLELFQVASGGFAYWPGASETSEWGSSYAGHFLVEAERAGYPVPAGMLDAWASYQRAAANTWVRRAEHDDLEQAYRLYTLALAGEPELGAMNRLRESFPTAGGGASPRIAARWRLAAAYVLAAQPEAARELVKGASTEVPPYRELSGTFGSDLRDEAMILETLVLLGDDEAALAVARRVSDQLAGPEGLNTQAIAQALIAMARFADAGPGGEALAFTWSLGGREEKVSSAKPLVQIQLPVDGAVDCGRPDPACAVVVAGSGSGTLFPRLILSGLPPLGAETASRRGLDLVVRYRRADDTEIDVGALDHGLDFVAVVEVTNSTLLPAEELALTHIVPSGWEIHGTASGVPRGGESGFTYRDVRDDRASTYFSLAPGEKRTFPLRLHSAYQGRFYLPPVSVEAMYDPSLHARTAGRWVEVEPLGVSG